ncbi:MAG: DUF805 domain-containing protein [Hyphomonadaceae bacterium]|nr:DUF805 domain-containing protein [Hyphomonadaceae bacterium]
MAVRKNLSADHVGPKRASSTAVASAKRCSMEVIIFSLKYTGPLLAFGLCIFGWIKVWSRPDYVFALIFAAGLSVCFPIAGLFAPAQPPIVWSVAGGYISMDWFAFWGTVTALVFAAPALSIVAIRQRMGMRERSDDGATGIFSFKGRMDRVGFFISSMSVTVALVFWAVVHAAADALLGDVAGAGPAAMVSGTGLVVTLPIVIWIYLAGFVRRLHDIGASAWWSVLCLPLLPLSSLVLLFTPSQRGENRFGP